MKTINSFALFLVIALLSSNYAYSQKTNNSMEQLVTKAQTQFASIDNKKIAYRKFGKGTPIIIANRFRGTLDTWDPLFSICWHKTIL